MVTSYNGLRCIRQRVRCLLALGMLVGMLASCGYTLVGAPPDTPGHQLPLAIVPFTNQTREPDLERLMTAALRQSILQSQIFSSASDGPSVRRLQGAIRRLRSIPLSFDQNDSVLQYRIEADFHIRLVEASTQRPALEQDITAWAEYLVSATGTVLTPGAVREDVVARQAALARLAQQFADKCLALLAIALL